MVHPPGKRDIHQVSKELLHLFPVVVVPPVEGGQVEEGYWEIEALAGVEGGKTDTAPLGEGKGIVLYS